MFDVEFLTGLVSIIIIDLVLGGDNAIVIAMASRKLPEKQRNKAIIFGTVTAIIVRAGLTFFALYLLTIPLLRFLGGVLLIWIAYSLLISHKEDADVKAVGSMAQAIRTIVFADILMGLDNVLAIAGAARDSYFLVIIGLLISVPIIVWGSKLILALIGRFPIIIYIGSGVLAWTAGNMITDDRIIHAWVADIPLASIWIPLMLVVAVLGLGKLKNKQIA